MLNEVAKKWVAALRSGKYQQTTGVLTRDNKYCCLGVLTELAVENGVIPQFCGNEETDDHYPDTLLSEKVRKWVGLTSPFGEYKTHSLVKDNDTKALNFSQIADIIESEPEGLFV